MSLRSLAEIATQIEYTYVRWEEFEISTGMVIDLFKELVAECRLVVEHTVDDAAGRAALQRVAYVVCELADTWRAHVKEELAQEEDEH